MCITTAYACLVSILMDIFRINWMSLAMLTHNYDHLAISKIHLVTANVEINQINYQTGQTDRPYEYLP